MATDFPHVLTVILWLNGKLKPYGRRGHGRAGRGKVRRHPRLSTPPDPLWGMNQRPPNRQRGTFYCGDSR
jgi:hypothetical protein